HRGLRPTSLPALLESEDASPVDEMSSAPVSFITSLARLRCIKSYGLVRVFCPKLASTFSILYGRRLRNDLVQPEDPFDIQTTIISPFQSSVIWGCTRGQVCHSSQ